jgi:hypothetical protein
MRKDLLCAATLAFLAISGNAYAGQNAQGQPNQQAAQQGQQTSSAPAQPPAPAAAQSATQGAPMQVDSLAEAARKAREQKKEQASAKPARVFNNDNIAGQGGVSTVGVSTDGEPAADGTQAADGNQPAGTAEGASANTSRGDEKTWRDEFARLRHKLEQDQAELEILQRELGVLNVQYYPDPVTGMQQELTRSDINEKTEKIEAKKKTIDADNQALADAEDRLHKAGGDPGWAR